MHLALKDAGQRTFRAQRICYRGTTDDFIDRRIRALDRYLSDDYNISHGATT